MVLCVYFVVSLLFSPKRFVVCDKRFGANEVEKLRTLTIIEWALGTGYNLGPSLVMFGKVRRSIP